MALAGAMAAAAALGISAGVLMDRQTESRQAIQSAEARQIVQELRAEHERLEREFQTLSEPPVVYVGGNEDVDLVLDLRNVRDAEGVVPAAFHNQTF